MAEFQLSHVGKACGLMMLALFLAACGKVTDAKGDDGDVLVSTAEERQYQSGPDIEAPSMGEEPSFESIVGAPVDPAEQFEQIEKAAGDSMSDAAGEGQE